MKSGQQPKIDKEKILAEIKRLLKPILDEQNNLDVTEGRYHRVGGQISILNNLKYKIEAGTFD